MCVGVYRLTYGKKMEGRKRERERERERERDVEKPFTHDNAYK